MGAVTQIAILEKRGLSEGFVIGRVRSKKVVTSRAVTMKSERNISEVDTTGFDPLDAGSEGISRDEPMTTVSFKPINPTTSCSKLTNLRRKGLVYSTCLITGFFG